MQFGIFKYCPPRCLVHPKQVCGARMHTATHKQALLSVRTGRYGCRNFRQRLKSEQNRPKSKKTAVKCALWADSCVAACHNNLVFAEPSRLCFLSGRPVVVAALCVWGGVLGERSASGHHQLIASVHLAGKIKRVGMMRSGSGCCLGA